MDSEKWYVAEINGEATLVTISHYAGRGRFVIRKDYRGRANYRTIDSSDIICEATPENSRLIIDSLFYRFGSR